MQGKLYFQIISLIFHTFVLHLFNRQIRYLSLYIQDSMNNSSKMTAESIFWLINVISRKILRYLIHQCTCHHFPWVISSTVFKKQYGLVIWPGEMEGLGLILAMSLNCCVTVTKFISVYLAFLLVKMRKLYLQQSSVILW